MQKPTEKTVKMEIATKKVEPAEVEEELQEIPITYATELEALEESEEALEETEE